jgi:F-type H+-transporting ATPase subunit delta
MSELATTARPYAKAAFESATAAGAVPAWDEFLQRVAAVESDARVSALIGNPRVRSADLVELLFSVASAGAAAAAKVSEANERRNFLHLLADNGRLRLLPEIGAQFAQLRADAEQVADVEVVSAEKLTEAQSRMLGEALERRFKRRIRLHPRVDVALIGGAVVRYGDLVIDGSMRTRIERLGAAVAGA